MELNTTAPERADGEPVAPVRRTILKGAAWTLPVVAVAAAAPLAAASDGEPPCLPIPEAEKSTLVITRVNSTSPSPVTTTTSTGGAVWHYPANTLVTWTWTLQNTGTVAVPAGIRVRIQLGRNSLLWADATYTNPTDFPLSATLPVLSNRSAGWDFTSTLPLEPGQTRTFTATARVPSGGNQGSITTAGGAVSPSSPCDDDDRYATVVQNGSPWYPQFIRQGIYT